MMLNYQTNLGKLNKAKENTVGRKQLHQEFEDISKDYWKLLRRNGKSATQNNLRITISIFKEHGTNLN